MSPAKPELRSRVDVRVAGAWVTGSVYHLDQATQELRVVLEGSGAFIRVPAPWTDVRVSATQRRAGRLNLTDLDLRGTLIDGRTRDWPDARDQRRVRLFLDALRPHSAPAQAADLVRQWAYHGEREVIPDGQGACDVCGRTQARYRFTLRHAVSGAALRVTGECVPTWPDPFLARAIREDRDELARAAAADRWRDRILAAAQVDPRVQARREQLLSDLARGALSAADQRLVRTVRGAES